MRELGRELDLIRFRSFEALASQTRLRVDERRLRALTALVRMEAGGADARDGIPARCDPVRSVALAMLFGAINYRYLPAGERASYRYASHGVVHVRSEGVARAMLEAEVNWADLDEVCSLTISTWNKLLQLSRGNQLIDAHVRLHRLRACARHLIACGVRFEQPWIERVSAQEAFELLSESGLFADPFLKRLHRTLADLGAVVAGCGGCAFGSPSFTALPDYRLPQLLCGEGAIVLEPQDEEMLCARIELTEDDPFVTLMRSATVAVCARIAQAAELREMEVDQALWKMAQARLQAGTPLPPPMNVRTRRF